MSRLIDFISTGLLSVFMNQFAPLWVCVCASIMYYTIQDGYAGTGALISLAAFGFIVIPVLRTPTNGNEATFIGGLMLVFSLPYLLIATIFGGFWFWGS